MVEEVDEKILSEKDTGEVINLPLPEVHGNEYRLFKPCLQNAPAIYLSLLLKDGRSVSIRYRLFEEIDLDYFGQVITIRLVNGRGIRLIGEHLHQLRDMLQQHMVDKIFEFCPKRYEDLQDDIPVLHFITRE